MTQRAGQSVTEHPRLRPASGGFYKLALVGIPVAETHRQLKHRRLQMNKGLLLALALIVQLAWIVLVLPKYLPLFL